DAALPRVEECLEIAPDGPAQLLHILSALARIVVRALRIGIEQPVEHRLQKGLVGIDPSHAPQPAPSSLSAARAGRPAKDCGAGFRKFDVPPTPTLPLKGGGG